MSSLAGDCVNVIYVSERIAKVVQSITCAAGAITMQSLAISLARFATTVSASVAIAQATAALAALRKKVALETVIIHRILSRGALHAKNSVIISPFHRNA